MELMNRVLMAAFFALSPLVVATGIQAAEGKHGEIRWGYEGKEGPKEWGDLKAEWAACKTGVKQSPIDLKSAQKGKGEGMDIDWNQTPLKIINNGHTIQVNYSPEAHSHSSIDGKEYDLVQFHFHAPSEHAVNGKSYPLEVHFVHKNKEGQLAVIGVFFKEGKANETLQKIWDNLPGKVGEEKVVPGVTVNGFDLLPPARAQQGTEVAIMQAHKKKEGGPIHESELAPAIATKHWHYEGSLTTPPCSEGVNWSVLQTPITASKEQIAKFRSIFKVSNRPVQALHGRQLLEH